MSDSKGIFEKIIDGEIPCWKVYEDEHVFSFLDIGPLSTGHTLVIPKKPYVTLDEVDDATAAALGVAIKKIGAAVAAATGCAGWNVLQNNGAIAGQVVMHVHFHIIPRADGDGLGYRWPAGQLDADAAKDLQAKITDAL
ncbi:MAG: HIT domain-containing protein [Phycisphaera sp.]|nr:HIT domain-containing protein [Phycisphaera sp.]